MLRTGVCSGFALAVLFAAHPAQASCGPVKCSLTVVDASCQPLESDSVQGDAVRVELNCSVTCCSGASNCGQSPYAVSAEALKLWRYVDENGSQVPDKSHAVSFRAHPSCANVYEAESCVASGKHVFSEGGIELDVVGDACAEGSGGCRASRGDASALWLAATALGLLAARRKRR